MVVGLMFARLQTEVEITWISTLGSGRGLMGCLFMYPHRSPAGGHIVEENSSKISGCSMSVVPF